MKMRSLAIGLTLLTAGTVIGVTTQQFASADISTGDRPVLVPIEPCRLVDTRPGDNTVGPRSSPLGTADTLNVDAREPGTDCTGVIPADASSLSLNVTAVGATELTFLTIWAGGPDPWLPASTPPLGLLPRPTPSPSISPQPRRSRSTTIWATSTSSWTSTATTRTTTTTTATTRRHRSTRTS